MMDIANPWFVLKTRSRSEKKVRALLLQKGYTCFLPMYRQKHRWSDRIVEVELPLFPTYIFCQFNPTAAGKAIKTPGVLSVVGFGNGPAEVDAVEIEALQRLCRSSLSREPWARIPHGTRILVETGPLAGVEGIYCATEPKKKRLIISVTMLQRFVAIQLAADTIVSVIEKPIGKARRGSAESSVAQG